MKVLWKLPLQLLTPHNANLHKDNGHIVGGNCTVYTRSNQGNASDRYSVSVPTISTQWDHIERVDFKIDIVYESIAAGKISTLIIASYL